MSSRSTPAAATRRLRSGHIIAHGLSARRTRARYEALSITSPNSVRLSSRRACQEHTANPKCAYGGAYAVGENVLERRKSVWQEEELHTFSEEAEAHSGRHSGNDKTSSQRQDDQRPDRHEKHDVGQPLDMGIAKRLGESATVRPPKESVDVGSNALIYG